jgi:isoaspartyl peptidase/L-asparaginase-like protein (Ntn-hydrolase superfamily)
VISVMVEPVVLVHGGAGNIPISRVEPKLVGVRRAARSAYKVLSNGGSVIDAVQSAVQDMEDDEAFNAGLCLKYFPLQQFYFQTTIMQRVLYSVEVS